MKLTAEQLIQELSSDELEEIVTALVSILEVHGFKFTYDEDKDGES